MGWFRKKKRTVDELGVALKPAFSQGDESQVCEVMDELIAYHAAEPEKVEGLLGYGVLVACENGLQCAGKYLKWFMEHFPNSLVPVKIEYASFLADREPDSATQLAREYLRVVHDRGVVENLGSMPMVQRGTSKAFLTFTAAYTTLGARSYSKRVLQHALQLPLDTGIMAQYRNEIKRLDTELTEGPIEARDKAWEQFFATGANGTTLYEDCQRQKYPFMAERVELLEGQFRFLSTYSVGPEEWFQLVQIMQTADGKQVRVLR